MKKNNSEKNGRPDKNEALRINEKKFKSIFRNASDGIVVADNEGRIVDLNTAARTIFGASEKKDLIHRRLTDMVTQESAASVHKKWYKIVATGMKQGEFEVNRTDGSNRIVEYKATANFMPNRHLLLLRDITERKIEERRQMHFLGIASHELKTPLASIKAYTQLLKKYLREGGQAKVEEYLAKVDDKTDKLTTLINDLLDITRIKQGKLEFFYELFDFDELLTDVIDEIQTAKTTHKIIAKGKIGKNLLGDKNRIAQVIANVIRNAVKYSPHANQVMVNVERDGEMIAVAVQDFGIGISEKEKKRIFELYYRGTRRTINPISGLGVGLYIANEIVKQHGGKMWVDSTRAKGSTFHFRIPLRANIRRKTKTLIRKDLHV